MMKKEMYKLLTTAGLMTMLFGGTALAAGWTYTTSGKQVYQQDDGSIAKNTWIKAEDNGNTIWYYATNDGSLKTDGWQTISGYKYYFDSEGVMQTGWVDDNKYYCGTSGAAVKGWRQLTIPDDLVSEYENDEDYTAGEAVWFYFNPSTAQRTAATSSQNVKVQNINGVKYGFDENGVMQVGWTKVTDTTPELAGYMYFATATDTNFKLGQQLNNTWYTTVGPQEKDNSTELATGNVEYFYFQANGYPVTGTSSYNLVKAIGGKKYLFNAKGNPVYGMQIGATTTGGNLYYYYCGTAKTECSVKTGRMTLNQSGDKITFYAQSNGQGYTGVRDGCLYYCGKLQKAETSARYMTCTVGGNTYVINSSGEIMKNKTRLTDKDGNKVSTNSDGTLKANIDGSLEALTPEAPEVDEDIY